MIYRLSTAYLSRLESERNSKLFYGYVTAVVICAVAIWKLGQVAMLIGVPAFVAAAVYHRKLNQFHRLRMAAKRHVEVEVLANQLIYRSPVGEQRLRLDLLQSVEQASKIRAHKAGFCGRAAVHAGWSVRRRQPHGRACRACSIGAIRPKSEVRHTGPFANPLKGDRGAGRRQSTGAVMKLDPN